MSLLIMVVDDEVSILALMEIMLKKVGFRVLRAENGHTALNLIETTTPDLFVLDVMMPGMDGFELCQRIRARTETANTPIIFVSAQNQYSSVKKGMEAGANAYLSKTDLFPELAIKVRELLGHDSSRPVTSINR